MREETVEDKRYQDIFWKTEGGKYPKYMQGLKNTFEKFSING